MNPFSATFHSTITVDGLPGIGTTGGGGNEVGIRWKSTTTIEGAIGMVAISQDIVRMSNSEPIVAETHAVRKNRFGVPGKDRHATTRRGMAISIFAATWPL